MSDALTCPGCNGFFVADLDADDDDEEVVASFVVCPICMKSFDPYAEPKAPAEPGVRLDELADLSEEDDGEELD